MAAASIYLVLLVGTVTRCRCDLTTAYNNNGNGASQFGELLKPPPPPISQILPVPFHGGAPKAQRQNIDVGYLPPPPTAPPHSQKPQFSLPTDFKFPAPFYKQYNFNFVPAPQPFITTPTPSLFQKVSTWLFPSQQTGYDATSNSNIANLRKDCNPCNLVPWIPVIRYNIAAKNVHQNSDPTYGPPSPTAQAQQQHAAQFQPQPFKQQNDENRLSYLAPNAPHADYGPPTQTFSSSSAGIVSSTYGPPSPTHTIGFSSQSPLSSTFTAPNYSSISSSTYGVPSSSMNQLSSSYLPSLPQKISETKYNYPPSTYTPPTLLYTTSSPSFDAIMPVTTYGPPITSYDPGALNNGLQPQSNIEVLIDHETLVGQQLPKVSQPTEFRNSYGELITNAYALDIPYPVSATAAESTKVKTEVLPNGKAKPETPNISMALANPAPFTLNRGRNIHTLQPVALPNLSVSPLPPIFNARPFRPISSPFPSNLLQGINQMQQKPNNVDIEQSVPLVEFTHSIDYPATYIQSPVIDIESVKINNQTKAYRNIPNHFVIDEIRDISSQASEDHVSATKTSPDSSFESTGPDVGNYFDDNRIGNELKMSSNVPHNHNPSFTDLRGLKDEDVDKYRTESNLQNIDSPLLYLKPSAPHKNYGNFVLAVSTQANDNEYEMYDDIPSTAAPPNLLSAWDESRNDYSESLSSPSINTYQSKIVQIIVPYTTNKKVENNANDQDVNQQTWPESSEKVHLARKVPSNAGSQYSTLPESYSTLATTTDEPKQTENYESERLNSAAVLNDLYDVKEPLFDIIKLQHTIDDWTEQEYSKYRSPQRPRNSNKYAKKIPDEYFTTTQPTSYVTETNNYYDFYDHEGSSSNHHTVTENDTTFKPNKEYNTIERTKSRFITAKNEEADEVQRLHIYTAASSFRTSTTTSTTTTTTPAPWGKIQTSISPLTKEKVYVVTSKPWRDAPNVTKEWYDVESFESKKTSGEADASRSDNVPFKPPRFMNQPSFGFTSRGKVEPVKTDSSYGFSRSWYQSINELETKNNTTSVPGEQTVTTNSEEGTEMINRHKYK